MDVVSVPDLHYFLDAAKVELYKYTKTFETSRDEPLVVLHTSGSTGNPKPVTITHMWCSAIDVLHLDTPQDGTEFQTQKYPGTRLYSSLPFFHVSTRAVFRRNPPLTFDDVGGWYCRWFCVPNLLGSSPCDQSSDAKSQHGRTNARSCAYKRHVQRTIVRLYYADEKALANKTVQYPGRHITESCGIGENEQTQICWIRGR